MFNKFKQKIADGVEGVSAGRQTPLRSTTPLKKTDKNTDSPEVGRAQAQNNGRIEDNLDCSSEASHLQNNSFNHPLEENYMTSTPLEISQEEEPPPPRPSSATGQQPGLSQIQTPFRNSSRQRRLSSSSNRSNSSAQDERGHPDSDMESIRTDNLSINELRELFRKQERSMKRYKQKFSEVVDAYKGLQKDKEKLEGTLTTGQDKQLRRIKELRETIELEQDSKRHLEESLRIELSEKDDKIDVLKTQVTLLKTQHGLPSPMKDGGSASSFMIGPDGDTDIIQALQDKIRLLNVEIEKLTTDNEQAHAIVMRSEQEKKTAIEGVMNNMHEILNEQEDLRSEVNILRDELKNRDITILNMRENEATLEERLKDEIMNEMRETVLANELKQQEAELKSVFEEKESQLKNLFADKVHDLQRVMEENEKQKQISLHQKDSDVTRKNDEILILKEQLNEWNDKEAKLKAKIQKIISEKEASDKRFSECQQQMEQDKVKRAELVTQHTKQTKDKQEEFNEQIAKVKRTSQTKVYEAQDQLRKKSNELNETLEKHKTEVDAKVKESTQFMQSEHAKASRKLEVKISDMKKMIKELRSKLSDKEGKCSELETTLLDTKTEVDQAKSLNTSLVESELKIGQLSGEMEALVEECDEWKNKYEILDTSYTKINLELENEKIKCNEITNERDKINLEMQQMVANVREDEGTLQNELNNLKNKFSYVEEESKELTSQLHNKISEIESLVKTLEAVNKELNVKDVNLSNKCQEFDDIKEKYEALCEEKQQIEYKHNENIYELEELKNTAEMNLKSEYELKLQEKDEDLRNQLSNVLNEKDSSVEVVTKKLEDMRKQELKEMGTRHEQQLNELNDDLRTKIDNVEKKHVKQNEEEKARLISEKDAIIEKLENELSCSKGNESQVVEDLTKKQNDLKLNIDEIKLKHKQDIEELESRHNEQIRNINENYEKEINNYKFQLESLDKNKAEYFSEVTKGHTEDKNILLKQIEEQTYNLSELKILCDQKDKEYSLLSEQHEKEIEELLESSKQTNDLQFKLDEQTNDLQAKFDEQTNDLQAKLDEQEVAWKEKHQNLEKKFKKIINDRDKKNKSLVEEMESKHSMELQSFHDNLTVKETELATQVHENDEQLNLLKQKIEEGNARLEENKERYENEISSLKSRENDAWSQLEQGKAEFSGFKERYENEIATLQTKSLEDKALIEESNVKLMSGESNSKEIDTKLSELLVEKSKLERQISNDQHTFEDKIRSLENECDNLRSTYEENIRKIEDRLAEEAKSFENEKSELLNKHSESEESNNNKLLDLKRKAETKISKLKKEKNEKIDDLESSKNELLEKISSLEARLEEQQFNHEKEILETKEYENKLSNNLEEYENTIKSASEKFGAEILTLNDELLVKSEKITQLEELLDNATVGKMESLKTQKNELDDEHEVLIKKIREESMKEAVAVEKKLTARIDEKDFEHNSEIKAMLKQFQVQLGEKDMEIQQSVQEAIEVAQKDEKKIICEYDEQIVEFQRELRLREQDMLELQQETQQQLDILNEEREVAERELNEKFVIQETEYHQRLDDLTKRHEEALQKKTSNMEESEANMNKHLNEMEEKYALKTQELEDNHKNDLMTHEKKYKSQLKQAKLEIRKLLAGKGANIPNGGDFDQSSGIGSNHSSDNEMDHSEVIKLKEKVATMSKELQSLRERERCLAMQAEQAPTTPKRNDRPATLHLSDNLNDTVSSPPKSPQPLEFEYLRNILYNYMMGKQRKQMAKVLTAIVHFSPSQVQQILAKVEEQESHAVVGGAGYFKWS